MTAFAAEAVNLILERLDNMIEELDRIAVALETSVTEEQE